MLAAILVCVAYHGSESLRCAFSISSDSASNFLANICFTGLCFSPKYAMLVSYPLQSVTSGIGPVSHLSSCVERVCLFAKERGEFVSRSAGNENDARSLPAVVPHACACAMDAYSRRLLAVYLTFDPPSYRSVMMVPRICVLRFDIISLR